MTRDSVISKFKAFLKDVRGNYALATIAVAVPLLGALALAVDYSQMSRERQLTLNALDAAGIATARRLIEGASESELQTYARNFFDANLGGLDPKRVRLSLVLPNNNAAGGGTLQVSATLAYDPLFFDTFQSLRGQYSQPLSFSASSEVKLKNTIEVALVLDNSGSMDFTGTGSGKKRMTLLKEAAKQLVDTLSAQSAQMKQLQNPVQFGLVPFAASVNVGPEHAGKAWMDTLGISPVHHENFNWGSINSTNKKTELLAGVRYARGTDWGDLRDQPLTRFTLYNAMKRVSGTTTQETTESYCVLYSHLLGRCLIEGTRKVETQVPTYGNVASWEGCVEARPYPFNVNDAAPSSGTPATLFVPMFAPDEVSAAYNNWWPDGAGDTDAAKQANMAKYFTAAAVPAPAAHEGPNLSCTTNPILPLTDVSKSTGVAKVKAAIDAMRANGATNVPEGMAWGWRVLSSVEPFREGRPETEKGNDKVVIVLTDGENTYYTPGHFGKSDTAGNKSIYSNYGYTGKSYNGGTTRLFMNTSNAVSKTGYTNDNYTKALNEHFTTLCNNAKAQGLMVMTVALDLSTRNSTENAQINALRGCASESRFRKDSSGNAAKLFWNATGSSLAEDFKSIADELSNLRIVS